MTLAFSEQPGAPVHMYSERRSYNPAQWARWQALDDAFYAQVGGRAHLRKPSIGLVIDADRYEKWKKTLTDRWSYESKRKSGTRGVVAEDMPESLLQYLYERLIGCEGLAETHGVDRGVTSD